jgi:diguanylate cyclase
MHNFKILIVEDEILIAENLANKLKKLGYLILDLVASGKAALNCINTETPDLILMDISLKGNMDGIETATKIRDIKEIPIVFLTAYADDETIERATQIGCYGYLLKPFKDKELQATIKMALIKHQEQIAIQNSLQATIHEYSEIQHSLQSTLAEYSEKNNSIHIDSLTKLPNKLFLRDLFAYLLSGYASPEFVKKPASDSQKESKLLAVIYLSLDRFQRINDSLGKDQEDTLIKAFAEQLTNCTKQLKEGIEFGIIRLQHSEFVILLSKLNHKRIAVDFTDFILAQLQQPFIINNQEIFLTASIGISFSDSENLEIELLLEQAKQAMKYAQQQGGNKHKSYTLALDMMMSASSEDIALETELHYALKRQELELYYQPNINLQTGQITSVEALIRWNHPQLGLITPNKFIHIAEDSSVIEPIGEWVLQTACKQIKYWHRAGFDFLKIAVNLSGRQFKQLDLFHKLTQILFNSNLEPQFLELELTEKILVDNIKANVQRLNLIKKLGISISLDDFGTGYCSLGYLQQFPFDTLKIDRCFISDIDRNQKNAIITKSIIEMAHELGLKVVAEGIETEAELAFLTQHQCDEVQGYFFSRPLPTQEFEKLLFSKKSFVNSVK